MKFNPKNRHLWIQPHDEEEDKDNNLKILVPTDYEKPKSQYMKATVLALADDCRINLVSKGDNVVIERRMLHNLEIENENIYLG